MKTIEAIGGTKEKGQKILSKADVFPMFKACKDSKDQGGFHDFVEIMKPRQERRQHHHGAPAVPPPHQPGREAVQGGGQGSDEGGFMPFIPFLEKMCAAEK